MSGSRTALKVISIIMIIFAGFTLVMGLIALIGGAALLGASNSSLYGIGTASVGLLAGLAGIVALVLGGLYLLVGILGIRGANNPQKIGPFYVLAIVGAVFNILGLLANIAQGTFDPSSLIGFALVIACVVLAYVIKKEYKEQQAAIPPVPYQQ